MLELHNERKERRQKMLKILNCLAVARTGEEKADLQDASPARRHNRPGRTKGLEDVVTGPWWGDTRYRKHNARGDKVAKAPAGSVLG